MGNYDISYSLCVPFIILFKSVCVYYSLKSIRFILNYKLLKNYLYVYYNC